MYSLNPSSTIFYFSQFHEHFQKQQFKNVLQNRLSEKFCNILNLKKSLTQVFSCEYCEIFTNSFFTELLRWLLLLFLKVIKQLFRKGVSVTRFLTKFPCYDVLLIFTSQNVLERHIVWCIKGRTRLFTNAASSSKFSK